MTSVIYTVAQGRLRIARFLNSLPVIGWVGRVVNRAFWGFAGFIQGANQFAPPPPPYVPPVYNYTPPPPRDTMSLSDLRDGNPEAYEAYVSTLVDSCQDEFFVNDNGVLVADQGYGELLSFEGGNWDCHHEDEEDDTEEEEEEYEEELPEDEDEHPNN